MKMLTSSLKFIYPEFKAEVSIVWKGESYHHGGLLYYSVEGALHITSWKHLRY